jgi:hypothetical protein
VSANPEQLRADAHFARRGRNFRAVALAFFFIPLATIAADYLPFGPLPKWPALWVKMLAWYMFLLVVFAFVFVWKATHCTICGAGVEPDLRTCSECRHVYPVSLLGKFLSPHSVSAIPSWRFVLAAFIQAVGCLLVLIAPKDLSMLGFLLLCSGALVILPAPESRQTRTRSIGQWLGVTAAGAASLAAIIWLTPPPHTPLHPVIVIPLTILGIFSTFRSWRRARQPIG